MLKDYLNFGAGVGLTPVLPAAGAAEGDALTERLNLNKLRILNFGRAVGLAVGLGVASVSCFLRERRAFGDADGDSAVAGEAAVSAGEAVASALFCWRCFFLHEWAIRWATRLAPLLELAQRKCWQDRLLKREQAA
jgi:hypothetical protein